LEVGFSERGLEWVPSEANFLLVKVGDGARIFAELQKCGVIVRPMKPYGMSEWLRVTVGTEAQNARLLSALDKAVAALLLS
jgi:histidinol-phosphate aminotransferase